MLQKIISFSVGNKLIVGLLTLALILYGVYETTKLPIDAVPDITDNQVQVITVTPALGAPDVERLITFPIEQANSNIPGLKEIRSFSRFGLSLVTIVFHDDVDVYWARQQVSERLQQVSSLIPPEAGIPELAPVTTGLGEIYQYVVRPKPGYEGRYSLTELRTIQDWIVRRQLLGTPGVADVSSFGGLLKQYEVTVKPEQLNAFQITIGDVFNAIQKNNSNTGGGYIEKGPNVFFIRSEGLATGIQDLENIVVKSLDNGVPLLMSQVAEIKIGAASRYGAMCYNDQGEVSGAVVMMLKGANSSDVIEKVKKRIEEIRLTLPEGILIEPFLDRTKMVKNAIGTVEKNLMEGALIVLFVLVLFLGNFRAGFLVASVIPLAMLFAIILMNTFGVSGNLMSLGALDFGLIVDGAVIIVEAVMHKMAVNKHLNLTRKIPQNEMDDTVKSSASRMMNAAVFGQVIILIVYLPILSLQGIEGKMFKPMAQTVAFALIGAFVLSLTYVPMMSALFLSKKTNHKKTFSDRWMEKIENVYEKSLAKILSYPKFLIIGALTLFAIAVFMLTTLGGEFIPELEEGDFAVDTRVLTGSNLNTTIEATQQTAKTLLQNFPEVEKVVTKIGSGEIPTDPMPIEASDMMVILKPKEEWTSAKTFDELAEKMSAKLKDVPGVTAGFQYPVQMRFNELMTGARQDVVCKIFGENLDQLALSAEELGKLIAQIEGAKDLYVESVGGMPQVVVNFNRQAIASYGLNIDEINQTLNTAFAGQSAGNIYEDEKRFNLVVRLSNEGRKNVSDINNLLIATPGGLQIPLRLLADVQLIDGPNQIQREDAKRRIVVGFNVRGRDVESVVNELREKVQQNLDLKEGYYITYGGSFENMKAAQARLSVALPVALLLIFAMLYFAFHSLREGLIIFSAIPFSAIGGVFALVLRGMPFSISAGVGFIALFGVAVLNGIVLISEFNRLRKEGQQDLRHVVLQGTKVRLRPVLMTAAVASLGFFPMALSNGAGAEVQRPLATVVIGGLITATLLTLYVLPLLYIIFDKKVKVKKLVSAGVVLIAMSVACIPNNLQAQSSKNDFSLEQAITSATKHNQMLLASDNYVNYYKVLSQYTFDLSKTSFGFEYGQFNSSHNDNKFSIQQNIQWPSIYKAQRQMSEEQWKQAMAAHQLTRQQTESAIKKMYYEWQIMFQMKKELVKVDSLFGSFEKIAAAQIEQGAGEPIEMALAQNQRIESQQKLAEVSNSLNAALNELRWVCGFDSTYVPMPNSEVYMWLANADSSVISNHPLYVSQSHQLEYYNKLVHVERLKLMPDFSLGYNNMSLKGTEFYNGQDVIHDGADRFKWISLGVQVPIFYKPQKQRIEAAKLQQQAQEHLLNNTASLLTVQWNNATNQYNMALKNLNNSTQMLLPNANLLIKNAAIKYKNGEINGLQWITIVAQAVNTKMSYFQNVRLYNDAAIALESFYLN
jgi:cobalt-zinc-cadmium resistance protein CzcA